MSDPRSPDDLSDESAVRSSVTDSLEIDSSESPGESSLIARQVRVIMASQDIKPHHQSTWLQNLLGGNISTSRRKVFGTNAYREDELRMVLDALGYEFRGLDGIRKKQRADLLNDTPPQPGEKIKATVSFEGMTHNCLVTVPSKNRLYPAARAKVLVMHPDDPVGRVMHIDEVPSGIIPQIIETIEIERPYQYEGSGPSVCVYNHDSAAAAITASALMAQGFYATHFSETSDLATAMQQRKFDACFFAWNPDLALTPTDFAKLPKQIDPNTAVLFSVSFDDKENPLLSEACFAYRCGIIVQPQAMASVTTYILDALRAIPGRKRRIR